MLAQIRKLLSAETKEDIEGAIAAIDIHALQTKLNGAEARRRELLLSGSDKQVLAAEAEITAARLDLERAQIALSELEAKLAVAKEKAEDDAFRTLHAEAAAARDKVVAMMDNEYAKAAEAIQRVIAAEEEAFAKTTSFNEALSRRNSEGRDLGLGWIEAPLYTWNSSFLASEKIASITRLVRA